KVIVVGAGPAGLAAALHLKRCGVETVVLEARDRVGGRVHSYSDGGFSAPVDLGASIITGTATVVARGTRPDPSTLIRQHLLPIYDGLTGQRVPDALDSLVDRVRDTLLDDARERVDSLGEAATEAESLGAALERAFANRFSAAAAADPDMANAGAPAESAAAPLPASLDEAQQRLLNWHWSNLEYGCSASLDQVSLVHWNQDEEYGGFGGQHCMVIGGYDPILKALAERLDVRLSSPVSSVSDTSDGVTVTTASAGEVFKGAAVIVTVPLGCLKAGDVTFDPSLPPWKAEAVTKLGFGDLNKVFLEFPHAFWENSTDFFGAAVPGGPSGRGRCFMFWNLQPMIGKPILVALVSGKAAYESEEMSDEEMAAAAMEVLGRLYGEKIPVPVCSLATKWGSDIYARGSYSYVAVGSSAKTYDALAAPVRRRLLWAGEHTCKEHPDTVGGAMLTGMREVGHPSFDYCLLASWKHASVACLGIPSMIIMSLWYCSCRLSMACRHNWRPPYCTGKLAKCRLQ
ncbi:amine oxidase, partial [Coccomyxa subellipsoidea C-169]